MGYEVLEAKINPSNTYPLSASVVSDHPLVLKTEFAADRRVTKPAQRPVQGSTAPVKNPHDPSLRYVPRTIY